MVSKHNFFVEEVKMDLGGRVKESFLGKCNRLFRDTAIEVAVGATLLAPVA